jgi:hypothetical protein
LDPVDYEEEADSTISPETTLRLSALFEVTTLLDMTEVPSSIL